ncbi:Regulatory protein AtoC [Burkholderia gladioli]|uniref:sigma-54-dependent transcriptional regulator n=2 Tax=Burkholderia gladioli TaxID=28095 RepID=UPI0013F63B21|nr:sigma-54 dependent transcriptional regulator [Burkholderia gladioli]NHH82848.1 Luminescence regulatory protein LuxO [Burkholderia gladioli]CAG9234868.1 Regulatory protein AtoC [Burkholderia gladioli]
MPRVLIIDDDADTREMLAALARTRQLPCDCAATLGEARSQMRNQSYDLVLCDLILPDGNGIELFDDFPRQDTPPELVFATGHATLDTAIDAMRQGASDYLIKPFQMGRLDTLFKRVAQAEARQGEVEALRSDLERAGRFGRMLGKSPAMCRMYDALARVAATEASVMLTGESGTGKELAAQTVHELSFRKQGPFVAVNCGAIPANLVESEMFGHDRGSFTGADRQHKGFFERADGGTLFLDEITEMPFELQVKLLRVLETGQVMRLGSSRETSVNVRIVAATNRDPAGAVEAGVLRPDLYHRINVFPLAMPPLRERGEDIVLLAEAFLRQLNLDSGRAMVFSDNAKRALTKYDWPGNVRELRNFVQRACIFADGEEIAVLPPPVMSEAHGEELRAQAAELVDAGLRAVHDGIAVEGDKPATKR